MIGSYFIPITANLIYTGLQHESIRVKPMQRYPNISANIYLCAVRCHQSHVADLVTVQIWDTEDGHSDVQTRRLRLLPPDVTCTYNTDNLDLKEICSVWISCLNKMLNSY